MKGALSLSVASRTGQARSQTWLPALGFLALVALVASGALPWLTTWPGEWVLPFRDWLTDAFAWFSQWAKPLTRAISAILFVPLHLVEVLLFRGVPDWNLAPLPWVFVVMGVMVFAHWQSGLRLALFCGACYCEVV